MVSSPHSSERPAKRQRCDPVIGLDVSGKLYYCRKSTLLSGSSYFSARFGDETPLDPDVDRIDEHRHDVFFIDRNSSLFEYVLEYLRTRKLPPQIGSFQENPKIWRALREEAEFFAIDGLSALLKVTFSCSPDLDGGKGILHWLGTNKRTEDYINPYTREAIGLSGWTSDLDATVDEDLRLDMVDFKSLTDILRHVQYRVDAKMDVEERGLLSCNLKNPIVLDFRKISVSPTHYSLRNNNPNCFQLGDSDWNFEGSVNGKDWIRLHEVREDSGAQNLGGDEMSKLDKLAAEEPKEIQREMYCDYMERYHRHTWEVSNDSGDFFRYIRIVGENDSCVHAIGLEIYGKVHEG